MLNRFQGVPNGDLVAFEARYHRIPACFAKYTDCQKFPVPGKDTRSSNAYVIAARQLKDGFQNAIMVEKSVFQLRALETRFCELASEVGIETTDSYTAFNFKRLLKTFWTELSFIPQPGRSELVCSSSITVSEALSKANEFRRELKEFAWDELVNEQSELYTGTFESDDSAIHKAIAILRKMILKT